MTSRTVQTWLSGPPTDESLAARLAVVTDWAPLGVDTAGATGVHWPPTHPAASSVAKHARVFATVGSGPPAPPPVLEKQWKDPGPNMLEPDEGPTHASSSTTTSTTAAVTSVLAKVVAHWTVHLCVPASQPTAPTPFALIAAPQSASTAQFCGRTVGQILLADAPAPWLSTGLSNVAPMRRATPGSALTVPRVVVVRIGPPNSVRPHCTLTSAARFVPALLPAGSHRPSTDFR